MSGTGISMSPTNWCSEAELADKRRLCISDMASPGQAWTLGRSERWIYQAARWTVRNIPAPSEDEGIARYRLLWDRKAGEPVRTSMNERIAIVNYPRESKRGRPRLEEGWTFAQVREGNPRTINIDPFDLPEWIDDLGIKDANFRARINNRAIKGLKWEETVSKEGSRTLTPKPRSSPLPLNILEEELSFCRKMLLNSDEPHHVSLCQEKIDIIEEKIAAAKRQPDQRPS
ncbi:hypothetical protein [Synechococcus sp. CBW1107]|uniref:hypothetical protein n=1 Tax=Synechococcus sp. CBW1107 TaxID=2789857 RepID=UPI002AD453E9|nr:hypothetical protein [Synechococcus sp. CBW1107]